MSLDLDPDKRHQSRAVGTLHVRWQRVLDPIAQIAPWLAGAPSAGKMEAPEPTMNFSEAGVAFDDVAACAAGDTLLVEVAIPGDPRRWRCTATVLRVYPIPIDERDEDVAATHRVAVQFVAAPEEAVEALRNYTDRTRRATGRNA
jgi:hypothetical protein